MFEDVIIGECNQMKASAIKIFDIDEDLCNTKISENSDEYWITDSILDLSGKISKDSKEGIELSRLIRENQEGIDLYISTIFLKNVGPQVVERKIISIKSKAFDKGIRRAKKEIKKALGF